MSHSQVIVQHDRINNQQIFFMLYLCTSSSESNQLTISSTNSVNSKLESSQQTTYTLNNIEGKKLRKKPKPQLIW